MQPVTVRILHPSSTPAAGDSADAIGGASARALTDALADARSANATRLADLFAAAGAMDVRVDAGRADGQSFGTQLRAIVTEIVPGGGLVVLGSGSIPLATPGDARDFLALADSGQRRALANNRYSADVVAIGAAAALASVPDLPNDNALPRWLAEQAGFVVEDLRRRWRLAIDLDSPLDVVLTGRAGGGIVGTETIMERVAAIRAVAADSRAEVVVAGRTSATTLRWLERNTASRTRALVEERGLRAGGLSGGLASSDRPMAQRPPRSVLGMVLEDHGPEALGSILAGLGDAAIVDTRVLLAHQLGPDESRWPGAEDRFASDMLLPDRIRDPWLRALTASARDAAIPVLLGGHTLVGPGVRLVVGRPR